MVSINYVSYWLLFFGFRFIDHGFRILLKNDILYFAKSSEEIFHVGLTEIETISNRNTKDAHLVFVMLADVPYCSINVAIIVD